MEKMIINKEDLSPMMRHYYDLKEENEDIIIFYRLGDFYELFFEDAILCSKLLDLTLTHKRCGKNQDAPMCGVPFKASETYIRRLIEMGYKVGICEQLSNPSDNPKEIVKRDIIRIITPGTIMEEGILEEKLNNFICCVYKDKNYFASFVDLSTGEAIISNNSTLEDLNNALLTFHPSEIISMGEAILDSYNLQAIKYEIVPNFSKYDESNFSFTSCEEICKNQFKTENLKAFELNNKGEIIALGALFAYLYETQKRKLDYFNKITYFHSEDYMFLDVNTKRNLELTETSKDRKKRGSLLWVLDQTKTAMGGRILRGFVEKPIRNEREINFRLKGIEELFKNIILREKLSDLLKEVKDLERLSAKIAYGSLTPRDALGIAQSIRVIPEIKSELANAKSEAMQYVYNNLSDLSGLLYKLDNCIDPNFKVNNFKSGHFIKSGYDSVLDDYRKSQLENREWIANLEQVEKEATGIKNLKISYNNVTYLFEVTNSQKALVPFRFIRKQTLTNAERYTTEELTKLDENIKNLEALALDRELELYQDVHKTLKDEVKNLQETGHALGFLDAILSLSTVAAKNNYVKPMISKNTTDIVIKNGRHPVVEALLKKGEFISNDTYLNNSEDRTMIITGPNMAGKSTYMRQVALITFMAHIGSFVPADMAEISLVDRIFTRIGASDDLIYGQSTFMVEMTEVATILNFATDKSLILLDEIGRGTATYDGLSIAWSVMDYLSNNIHAKTLFSTHYHELTELEGVLDGVKNYRISVKEFNDSIIFLRKIVRGGALKSFGIEVASLAGLPESVIINAREILKKLENADVHKSQKTTVKTEELSPKYIEAINILKEINIDKTSPIEAFSILHEIKERLKWAK